MLFASRRPVRGVYAGRHASRQHGHSVEFSDYRPYTPGDEIAGVDWKAYARSDRLFIKLFEHQTDMDIRLLVDASASMGYAGLQPLRAAHTSADQSPRSGLIGKVFRRLGLVRDNTDGLRQADSSGGTPVAERSKEHSKYDQACLLAAAVALLTVQQQDRIGFAVSQEGLQRCLPARGGMIHLDHILHSMEQVQPTGEAHLHHALRDLAHRPGRRGLLVLLSDLIEDRGPIIEALGAYTAQDGEAVVFHVLHQDELTLPDLSEAVFTDSESGRRVRVDVRDIRPAYQRAIRETIDGWRRALQARGIDYQLVSTATPYHKALADYLMTRAGGP